MGKEVYLRILGCESVPLAIPSISFDWISSAGLDPDSFLCTIAHIASPVAMKDYVNKNRKEIKQHTALDMAAIDGITYLNEFDRVTQCPLWGYPSETAYYRDASSTDAVLNIKIPYMALSATDDPVCDVRPSLFSISQATDNCPQIALKEGLPYQEIKQNPNTVMVTTSLGGHLCWFEVGGTRWHTRPV